MSLSDGSTDTLTEGPSQDDPDFEDDFDDAPEYEEPFDCDVKVLLLRHNAELPKYANPGDAGADLFYAPENPDDEIVLQPLGRTLVPTGLAIALPPSYEAQIRPRSSAFKTGLTLINSPGTIDSGYRGEIMLPIVNLSQSTRTITPGQRLAQMVIQQLPTVRFSSVKQLDETARGEDGFGSTGL